MARIHQSVSDCDTDKMTEELWLAFGRGQEICLFFKGSKLVTARPSSQYVREFKGSRMWRCRVDWSDSGWGKHDSQFRVLNNGGNLLTDRANISFTKKGLLRGVSWNIKLYLLVLINSIIKSTRCTNFSNLFLK